MKYLKKRYIVFAILAIYWSFRAINGNLLSLLYVVPLFLTLYLINQVEKGRPTNLGLTQNEKIQVIITEFFNPLIAGAFYYYCWKKGFPKKASQANLYSWAILGIEVVGIIGLIYLGLFKLH